MIARDELYAVLITLPGGDTLLLPNAAVVEVLSTDAVAEAAGPEWLAGRCEFRGRSVPVVDFERLNGAAPVAESPRTRVTVLNGLTGKLPGGLLGVLSQGYPHLVTLNRAAVVKDMAPAPDVRDLVLTRVRIANTRAAIPNLEAVEREVAGLDSPAAAESA